MTAGRAVAAGSLVVVAIVAVWLIFFRQTGHEYTFLFQNAGQIVKGNEVRIAGRPIGKVRSIGLTEDNRARIKVTVDDSNGAVTAVETAS